MEIMQRFLGIVGSIHDAHIFRNSALCARFQMGQFRDSLLMGSYPVKKYLVTPLSGQILMQKIYTMNHSLEQGMSSKEVTECGNGDFRVWQWGCD